MCAGDVLPGTGSAVLLVRICASLGSLQGSLARGNRVILIGIPVLPCARVRGPSCSFTWHVTTGGVVHWVGCEELRTWIAAWSGVEVAQPGPVGFASRSAIGEPGGAIFVGALSEAGGGLIRVGEAPPALGSPLPPLPLWYRPPPI